MFDIIPDVDTIHGPRVDAIDPLPIFVQDHCDALLDAAALLAGRRGARLAQSVIDGVTEKSASARRSMQDLGNLLDILMLEHVHDIGSEEAARFAAIDPCDPCVEEICLLADGLRDAMDATIASREDASDPRTCRRGAR